MEIDDVWLEDLVCTEHAEHVMELERPWLRVVPDVVDDVRYLEF